MSPRRSRFVLRFASVLGAALMLAACGGEGSIPATVAPSTATPRVTSTAAAAPPVASSTPASTSTAEVAASTTCTPNRLTPAQTEGPYYTQNPPQRSNLVEAGMTGTRLTLTGYVLSPDCRPIPGARVDFWQADASGGYDNSGYRLRGYQITDSEGRYRLESIVPGEYPGRTEHIHVKITPPGGATVTTQLYFPNVARNASDGIFSPALVVEVTQSSSTAVMARFDFVLPVK